MITAAPAFHFPARPINGGPLERARPKRGTWAWEPKLNGWRTLVHAPTRTMWNRHGQLLSIASEFAVALNRLRKISDASGIDYFDCEGLERRHNLGRGCLYILDYLPWRTDPERKTAVQYFDGTHGAPSRTWITRSGVLEMFVPRSPFDRRPEPDTVLRPDVIIVGDPALGNKPEPSCLLDMWQAMQKVNRMWGCEFYEGFVAKRADRPYPRTLSATQETHDWMKHRWAF